MISEQGRPFRGEYDGTPAAGVSVAISLFDVNGGSLTLAADERLVVTDVAYRSTAATTLRTFFDFYGDALATQPNSPTFGHAAAGTGIGAGTYTFYYTYYDPFTKSESVRSGTNSVTVVAGENITVNALRPIPAYMKDKAGNLGYIKVYQSGIGLMGQSLPGTNSVTLTSLTSLGPETAVSGGASSGKAISGAFLPATGLWTDAFSCPKVGPPGVTPMLNSSVSTPIIVHLSGRIIRDSQL
jgi:hypothetical protein